MKAFVARRMKASTLAFFKEGRKTPGYSLFDALHGYVYARWPYLYIGLGTGRHPAAGKLKPLAGLLSRLFPPRAGSRGMAETYHGKVVTLPAATRLVQVHEPVRLENLETIIPYAKAKDIILQHPEHIVALDCPCRAAKENPCLPLDVCLIVGEPFASFVTDHHPGHTRWISQQEAVHILQAEHERGHVHHAFFKDAMLGRFYAICNCCPCCCGAMQSQRSGTPMLASSGYTAHVDEELCLACGECQESCPFDAMRFTGEAEMAHRLYGMVVDEARCMGCGVCVDLCANRAIRLWRNPEKGEPLEIQELIAAYREPPEQTPEKQF